MVHAITATHMINTRATASSRLIWPIALVLVTLLALGLRWYFVSTAMVVHPIRGDATQYVFYAYNLFNHGVFSGSLPHAVAIVPSDYRDPGYPAFLALWMACFSQWDTWYASVLMSQAGLGALTVTCAMQLGRRWLGWRWAIVAGVLMAVWPHNIVITSDLLSETLFGFLCALAMLVCARACDRGSPVWAVVAGLCFGAAALTNAVLLPFGILIAVYLAWRRLVTRRVWIALLVGAVVLPGAWAIRNSQLPPQDSTSTSLYRAEQNLVQGAWPSYHAAYRAVIFHSSRQGQRTLAAIGAEVQLLHAHPERGLASVVHRLGQHPWQAMAWYAVVKPRDLWGWNISISQGGIYVYPVAHSPFRTEAFMRGLAAVCYVINPVLALLMLACLVGVLLRRSVWRGFPDGRVALEITLVLVVFVTLVYCTLQSDPRYAIPFRAFEVLLAMATCRSVIRYLRKLGRASRKQAATTG